MRDATLYQFTQPAA